MHCDADGGRGAPRGFRPGLVLEAGTRRFPILDLSADSCLIEASDSAALRGFADIWDGERHLSQCLLVVAAPEGDLLRCSFKRRTPFRLEPPRDFA
ncbi:hypothetical protein [Amaricoccus sp.]|uniref:hypothetical protein n=1 Tax=Amaricoccus sp. TaxID=1872485 RepID=UPI001B46F0F5|nr:hypothetical protein [Amaricoccus sp.]MBP7241165.1 hypothetical protein [Amaricoccus sp.]